MIVFVLSPGLAGPSDAASSMPASSSDSSDSYNGDDVRRYVHELRMAQNHYSEATWENSQLEIHLGVSHVALHAAEEEANAARVRLAESDAAVAGKMNFRDASILISAVFILIALPLP